MEFYWIEDPNEFKEISVRWDKFLIEEKAHNPFLLSDFILTWWKYYQKGRQFRFLVFYDNNQIQGGIPLYLGQRKWKHGFLRTLTYVGDGTANYTEPHISQRMSVSLFIEALKQRNDVDLIYLTDVRHSHFLVSELQKPSSAERFRVQAIQDHYNWAIDLSGGVELFLKKLPGKLRRDIRSCRRRAVKELGKVDLIRLFGEEEIRKCFEIYISLSQESFKKRGEKSACLDTRYAHFFRDFFMLMEKNQRFDAHILKAGEEILAISFAYRFGKGFNWVLTTFNYQHRHLSPGYLLIEELIREVQKRGESYYNWYGYKTFPKHQWCNLKKPLYRVKLFKNHFYLHWAHNIETRVRNFLSYKEA